jgi:predicted O-methyltransferase YrrM
MEHFYEHIQGWFDYQKHYTCMVNEAREGAHFVEVGSWKGKSSSYMAVEIINSGKNIRFDCVDTWGGSPEHQQGGSHVDHFVVDGVLFDHFIDNMKPVEGYYNPVKNYSIEAAKLYADNSLDFVFIDAAHDYENVKADIQAWLPKVKIGGWIGGHDYTWNEGIRRACRELLPEHIHDASWDDTEQKYIPEKESDGVSWLYQLK